jgi:hypothetical protein
VTIEEASKAIEDALDAIDTAYWLACDAECRALDPEELSAPDGLLDDAYHAALIVEGIAEERGISWHEARDFV